MTPRPPRRLLGAILSLLGAVLIVGSVGPLAWVASVGAAKAPAPSAVAASVTCPAGTPAGDTCFAMPSGGGIVEAGPINNLGPSQWVYLHLVGFSTAGTGVGVHINYCSNAGPIAAALCVDKGSAQLLNPAQTLVAFNDGTSSTSFQIAEAQPPNQLGGVVPESGGTDQPFSCDSADPCSIDVTEGFLNGTYTPSTANTIAIPITFRGAGCPTGTPLVTTESEFGIEQLLPQMASVACAAKGSTPVLALDTAVDGVGAVSALTGGSAKVAFTEDPESADQQALLKKGHYGLIPVALTANVVGYKAYMQGTTGFLYPLTSLDLTPTEVAGLATYLYTGPSVADVAPCPAGALPQGWCTDPSPCLPPVAGVSSCEILGELNSQPGGFILPTTYGSYVRSDATGITDQLFSWLCQATNRTVTWNGQTATEPATGGATLLTGLNAGLPSSGKLTSCPATDTFPSLTDFGGTQAIGGRPARPAAREDVQLVQHHQRRSRAGFAPMNWAESLYYGLNAAQLENAAGDFVAPTAASIDAAVSDATANPDGSLAFSYTKADAAAYPMPSVVYAAVPTTPMSATDASQVKTLLNEILDLTGGKDSSQLPGGFVPLTAGLYSQAQAAITKDITVTPPTSTPTTKPPTPTSTTAPAPSGGSTPSRGRRFQGAPPWATRAPGSAVARRTSETAGTSVAAALAPGKACSGQPMPWHRRRPPLRRDRDLRRTTARDG